MRVSLKFTIAFLLLAPPLASRAAAAQGADEFIRAGVEAQLARDPETGRHWMEQAVAAYQTRYPAGRSERGS